MFFVGTSDEEDNVPDSKDRSVDRHGVSPYDRHLPPPVRRRGASTPMEKRYLTETPQLDRHSTFDHRFLLLSKSGQCPSSELSARNECFDASLFSRTRQKDRTEDEPMTAKVRFFPFVSSVRKSSTDEPTSKHKWEGRKGISPPAGESSRNLERHKSRREVSTGQKTNQVRYYRFSSSDSGTDDADFGAQKKSTPSTDGKISHHALGRSPKRSLGSSASRTSKSTRSKTKTSTKTRNPRTSRKNRPHSRNRKRSSSPETTTNRFSISPSPNRGTSVEGNSSFDDSSPSSDSEFDRLRKISLRKHLLKHPKFDGKRSFEAFWAHFCNCAEYNGWNKKDKLIFLRNSLDEEVANVL